MIKFVCASCDERLSVPDQHAGRKGLCPSCGAVNRIPLKGFAEMQPDAPGGALPAHAPAAGADPLIAEQAGRGSLSIPALSGRAEEPAPPEQEPAPAAMPARVDEPQAVFGDVTPTVSRLAATPAEDRPRQSESAADPVPTSSSLSATPGNSAPAASFGIFGSPANRESVWTSPPAPQESATSENDDMFAPPARPERRLPRPVKIILLVIAVLGIVGGLYSALYFGIQALMSKVGSG